MVYIIIRHVFSTSESIGLLSILAAKATQTQYKEAVSVFVLKRFYYPLTETFILGLGAKI